MYQELMLLGVGSALTGLGWLIVRRWTGAAEDEKTGRAIALLKLRKDLTDSGMGDEDIERFIQNLQKPRGGVSLESLLRNEDRSDSGNAFSILDTTAAMGVQLDAKLETLDKTLEELMIKIEIVCGDEHYAQALRKAQKSWEIFRRREGMAAFQEMLGGTGRTINSLAKEIEITEMRIEYLEAFLSDLKARYR